MSIIKILFAREHWLEIGSIILVGLMSFLFYIHIISTPVLLAAILIGLIPIAKTAFLELIKERKIGTELFITVAVVISIIGKEMLAGAIVLMIILLAEYIASVSTERARASIKALVGEMPKTALVKKNGEEKVIDISSLQIGDIVLIRAGDKIPVDGIVIHGDGAVNQAPITGESLPQEKNIGSIVYAGTILDTGALDVKVTKLASDTVFARIILLVEEAGSKQAPIQRFTDKVASWLIPVVFVFIAIVYFYTRDVKLIIALLIFTSPAELGLATPLVTISAIARMAREGILVKGGLYLEGLAQVDIIAFDKTGTLTVGKPQIHHIEVIDTNYSEEQILGYAAGVDSRSNHPLAKAVVVYAAEKNISIPSVQEFVVINGRGVSAKIDDKQVLLGNKALLEEKGIIVLKDDSQSADTVLFLAVERKLVAALYVQDSIRPTAKAVILELNKQGIETVMLTGDDVSTAKEVAEELGIKNFQANLLPEDKINAIIDLQKNGKKVAMIGDGINDAPALAAATVGIAMGALGTEAAMEAADVVLVNDDLTKIARARAISKRAYRTIKENIFVGVGVVHVTGITLVLLHVIGPIQAAAIHLVPDFLVLLNSVKLLKIRI